MIGAASSSGRRGADDCRHRRHERTRSRPDLFLVGEREPVEDGLARAGQRHHGPAVIGRVSPAPDKAPVDQPIHQPDEAVMLELEPFG